MIKITAQTSPSVTQIPGVAHSTWVSAADGLSQLSVWRQTLAPALATPLHSHDCDEVVLCLSGWGEVHGADGALRFGGSESVILPKNQVHQLFNVGPMPLELIGIFGASPVKTFQPTGEAIVLPWAT